MTLSDFLARLERVKKTGGNHQARCPAHDDRTASLSITEGDDGRILVKCFAGCETEAIMAALGLQLSDLFDKPDTPGGSFAGRVEHVYDYTDEEGKPLFQAVRLRDPKDFRQRHKHGGKWEWNLKGVRRVPYRLPELVAAAEEHRAAWVCEGEKDADALAVIGFTATTAPMGAGSWQDDYAAHFKGCAWALIAPDCDEPGRKHGQQIAASLHAAGVKAKVIDLGADRSDGYDVTDLILEHGENARAELERLARRTPEWPRNKPVSAPVISGHKFGQSGEEYNHELDYLGPFLHGGERVHTIGPIGHGKTTFLLEALSAALRGDDFLGWKGKGGDTRGLFINLEMPNESLRREMRDARLFDRSLKGRFDLWDAPDGLEIDKNERHREQVASVMGSYQIVVIDPWYKLIGDELSEGMSNVRPVIAFLDGLRKRHTDTSVVVGFHSNEAQKGQKLRLGDASGYKAYQRPCDTAVIFQRIAGDRSRLLWVKTRTHLLPKIGEQWLIEWERGNGFHRVERRKASDELLDVMTDEWRTTGEIAEEWGKSRGFTSETLGRLYDEHRVDSAGNDGGGRGNRKVWRLANADQEALDLGEAA